MPPALAAILDSYPAHRIRPAKLGRPE